MSRHAVILFLAVTCSLFACSTGRQLAATIPVRAPGGPTELGLCDCHFVDYGGVSGPQDGLSCKKEGFFVAGFETPGQYSTLRQQYIPLSRAICCRPCLSPGSALPSGLNASGIRTFSADCEPSTRSSSFRSAGLSCPSDSFVQGFQHDVRANPGSAPADKYFYPEGAADCCAPRILLESGDELKVTKCNCAPQSASYSVGCGASNTPAAAAEAGRLVYAFSNEITAMGSYGQEMKVPVTPVQCCKACISPNTKPGVDSCAAHNFCSSNGVCTIDGQCECDLGWTGEDCSKTDPSTLGNDGALWNSLKIVGGILLGCCGRYFFCRCMTRGRGRRRGLHQPLLDDDDDEEEANPQPSTNDFDFEASDLSTSDDEEDEEQDEEQGAVSEEAQEQAEVDAAAARSAPAEGAENANDGADEAGDEAAAAAATGAGDDEEDADDDHGASAAQANITAMAAGTEEELKDLATFDVDGGDTTTASQGGGASCSSSRPAVAECNVCMSSPVQVVLIPCGHACMCRKCSRRLRRCPICRVVVERRQKLYMGF